MEKNSFFVCFFDLFAYLLTSSVLHMVYICIINFLPEIRPGTYAYHGPLFNGRGTRANLNVHIIHILFILDTKYSFRFLACSIQMFCISQGQKSLEALRVECRVLYALHVANKEVSRLRGSPAAPSVDHEAVHAGRVVCEAVHRVMKHSLFFHESDSLKSCLIFIFLFVFCQLSL